MIPEILAASLAGLLIYLIGLAASNNKKYQFFKKNAPGLKVVNEKPSWFGGHSVHLIHTKYNWRIVDDYFKEHGPTFGFFLHTQPTVVTKDLDFIKTFTVDEKIHINRMKLNLPWKEIEEDCIMFAENEQWVRLRKAIAPAFSTMRIKSPELQAEIESVVKKLVGKIEQLLDQEGNAEGPIEVNLDDVCHRFALAIVFSIFYKQRDVIDFHSDKDQWVEMIERSMPKMFGIFMKACGTFPILRYPMNWFLLHFDDQGRMRNTIIDFIKQQTEANFEAARREKGAKNLTLNDGSKFRRNTIDYIVDQYRDGKLNKSEFFNSTFFLFHAAHKTTADSLSRCLYNLACHPETQQKLRDSILSLGTESEYLSWVVHESLRLCPPAHIGCSRKIKRDIQTKHGLVPAGTFCITPAYSIGRLREYWGEDADEFRPERWANASSFHPVQYLAFGGGTRVCPGRELALLEIRTALSALVLRYKFERSDIHTVDNSQNFAAPIFTFLVFDTPTYVKISRL